MLSLSFDKHSPLKGKKDAIALRLLAELRLRAGDLKEALELAKEATAEP